ncbi:hypothetical protein NOW01_00900 [Anoxybacillus salavatliensis]|uniref:hypothetical protein n=1 Tax=Anoxybacillus gonensis TaxID=198467 RepID=UPI00214ABD96|nr:hypothetical protein [Anoxybacillus gonensis]MCQ5363556.1 hypothetical protein [Anoxybacillus gonensis]
MLSRKLNLKIDDRTKQMNKNVIYNFVLKGMAFIVNLLYIRVSYNFFNDDVLFGVWMTILTFLTFITMIDLGLGNGLRNELIKLIATNSLKNAQILVSTTYFYVFLIVSVISLVYLFFNSYINWNQILNSDITNLKFVMNITIITSLINLFFGLIFSISNAYQKNYIFGFFNLLSNLLIVILLIIVELKGVGDQIVVMAFIYGTSNIIVSLLANLLLFKHSFRKIKPQLNKIRVYDGKNIIKSGINFFFLQVLILLIMSINNVIILKILGPTYVTEYQLAFRLFNILVVVAGIIFSPLWSAYRDAYIRKDYVWMTKVVKRNWLIFLLFVIVSFLLVCFGNSILKVWINEKVSVDISILILTAVYSLLIIWQSIHAYLLNSINKFSIQIITFIIGLIIGIPSSIMLGEIMGVPGVLLGSISSLLLFSIVAPYKIRKELEKN